MGIATGKAASNSPGKIKTMIYLEPDQSEALRGLSYRMRVPVAALIREAIAAYLKKIARPGA